MKDGVFSIDFGAHTQQAKRVEYNFMTMKEDERFKRQSTIINEVNELQVKLDELKEVSTEAWEDLRGLRDNLE